MPALVIEDISPELYAKLEQKARQHHRSITRQIVALLEYAITQPSKSPIPPTPIDLGVRHDSEWVYAATREERQ